MNISIIQGDITTVEADAIVNAANTSLLGGGGVDGAIHRKGGSRILDECKIIRNRQGGCKTGDAVYTTAGLLPAKYVIHTVGPVWNKGQYNEPELLASCYKKSLDIAVLLGIASIAFPNISTGIYGYPKDKAALVAINTVNEYIRKKELGNLDKIVFVCYDDENFKLYQSFYIV